MRRSVDGGEVGGGGEAATPRIWWGLLLGSLVTLSGFWLPVGLALWWWLQP
jgi:hypothetical protein